MVLLVVLFIVMAATVLSLGFLSRSSAELASGKNMAQRVEIDYLAESGLEHAKNLILSPQEVTGEYWEGAEAQQLVAGSYDFYDVNVVKLGEYNYQIISDAYRSNAGGSRLNQSSMEAQLRLDPCIAFWAGNDASISPQITITGDVYCNGNLSGSGYIGGDAIASGAVTATNVLGQKIQFVPPPVPWPPVTHNDFSNSYYIGSTQYFVQTIPNGNFKDVVFATGAGNPAGVYYSPDKLTLSGGVIINGTLVVNGDLKITGPGNIITAVKNFPALIVNGKLEMERDSGISINGLAIIEDRLDIKSSVNISVNVNGALFIRTNGIEGDTGGTIIINVTSAPSKASIRIWPAPGNAVDWSPVGGAFFKSITRR